MQPQLAAMQEVAEFLAQNHLRYTVIGGIANAIWGNPRATKDADFKAIVGDHSIEEIVHLFQSRFKFRVADALEFALRTYVLPIYGSNGIEVDIGLGFLPYEEQAVEKSVLAEHLGVKFRVCTAEDLIVQKAVSLREKDWEDIAGVLQRQGRALQQDYIRLWLEQFAEALERPEMIVRYEKLREKFGV